MNWIVGAAMAALMAYGSFRFRWLTKDGAVAAFVIGWLIFSVGTLPFSVPILVFFLVSNILAKVGKRRKSKLIFDFQQGAIRNYRQVLANGLAPVVLIVFWELSSEPQWAWLFVAAIAAAAADTWATEIGVLSKHTPRLITNFEAVPPGRSGAVSVLGMAGAVGGAVTIALTGYWTFEVASGRGWSWGLFLFISAIGFVAQLLDSVLGATVQVQYRCPRCAQITERDVHCSTRTQKLRGFKAFDNDLVNLTAISIGIVLGWISLTLFR